MCVCVSVFKKIMKMQIWGIIIFQILFQAICTVTCVSTLDSYIGVLCAHSPQLIKAIWLNILQFIQVNVTSVKYVTRIIAHQNRCTVMSAASTAAPRKEKNTWPRSVIDIPEVRQYSTSVTCATGSSRRKLTEIDTCTCMTSKIIPMCSHVTSVTEPAVDEIIWRNTCCVTELYFTVAIVIRNFQAPKIWPSISKRHTSVERLLQKRFWTKYLKNA